MLPPPMQDDAFSDADAAEFSARDNPPSNWPAVLKFSFPNYVWIT